MGDEWKRPGIWNSSYFEFGSLYNLNPVHLCKSPGNCATVNTVRQARTGVDTKRPCNEQCFITYMPMKGHCSMCCKCDTNLMQSIHCIQTVAINDVFYFVTCFSLHLKNKTCVIP